MAMCISNTLKQKESRSWAVRLNTQASDWSQLDFMKASGIVHVEGTLTLNDVKIRCLSDLELNTPDRHWSFGYHRRVIFPNKARSFPLT